MRRYVLAFSLVGLTFFALAPDAAADLLAEVSFNGGAFLPICTALPGGTCVGSVGVGGLVVSMAAAQSNSPGNSTLVAVLLSSAVSLMNTNTSGTATAHLLIGDTSWAVPTGAVTMLSHIGGSVAVGGPLNTMAFFSSFDPGTGQNVSPGTFNTPAVSPNISAAGSYDATSSVAIPLVSVPPSFAMTENLTITLSGGSIMNYSTSTTLSPSTVPEPVSLLLIGTSLIGLGVPLRRRKRTVSAQSAT
jgi:hypothetical protein